MTKQMNPAVAQALSDWRAFNECRNALGKPCWWATFEAIMFDSCLVVRVNYGVIHSNGFKECTLRTAHYHVNASGEVEIS